VITDEELATGLDIIEASVDRALARRSSRRSLPEVRLRRAEVV
jgi:hypothetical protein